MRPIEKYVEANSSDCKYGYGDAWEKTYVFNSIGTFVNLFGGDYYDWTNPKTQEAVRNYQRKVGLSVDGIVGCNTWRALQEAVVGTGATSTTVN